MFNCSLLLWRDLSSVLIDVDGESDAIIVNSYSRCYTVCCFRVKRARRIFPEASPTARLLNASFQLFHLTAAVPAFARSGTGRDSSTSVIAAGGTLASAQMARSGRPVGTMDGRRGAVAVAVPQIL